MAKFIKQSETLTIRNKTNSGDLCKTQFTVCGKNNKDVALIIHRLTLAATDSEYHQAYAKHLKRYGNKSLWFQAMAIRLTTLKEVADWLNTLNLENEFN